MAQLDANTILGTPSARIALSKRPVTEQLFAIYHVGRCKDSATCALPARELPTKISFLPAGLRISFTSRPSPASNSPKRSPARKPLESFPPPTTSHPDSPNSLAV